MKIHINHETLNELSESLSGFIMENHINNQPFPPNVKEFLPIVKAYPIPRGGIPAAYLLKQYLMNNLVLVDSPEDADIFIDDIIDSGSTMKRYCDQFPERPFYALIDKTDKTAGAYADDWIVFPWEKGECSDSKSDEDIPLRLLQFVGETPEREGLLETPKRFLKAWDHWTSGYHINPADILKVFEDGASNYDQMVVVKDIPVYSKCEHHLADIFGTATIAYIPNGKIVGLSKLSRLVDIFGRRLQVQERLTGQIADALNDNLDPIGVGVMIKARHMCMESRGICQQGHHTITTALRGAMLDKPQTRAEFLQLAN